MKYCKGCKKWKPKSDFHKSRSNRDGLSHRCKECDRKYRRRYYMRTRKSVKRYRGYEAVHRVVDGVKQKRCSRCNKWKDESEFGRDSRYRDQLNGTCKKCECERVREYHIRQGKILRRRYKYEESHRIIDGIKQKRCRKCARWKPESDFYKHWRNKDGLESRCKKCISKAQKRR